MKDVQIISHPLAVLDGLNPTLVSVAETFFRRLCAFAANEPGEVTGGGIASGSNKRERCTQSTVFEREVIKRTTQNRFALWLLPDPHLYHHSPDDTLVLIETPHANYTAQNCVELFRDIDFEDGPLIYDRVRNSIQLV